MQTLFRLLILMMINSVQICDWMHWTSIDAIKMSAHSSKIKFNFFCIATGSFVMALAKCYIYLFELFNLWLIHRWARFCTDSTLINFLFPYNKRWTATKAKKKQSRRHEKVLNKQQHNRVWKSRDEIENIINLICKARCYCEWAFAFAFALAHTSHKRDK